MRDIRLGDDEASDAAAIVRRYAQQIRDDAKADKGLPANLRRQLEAAAKMRDRLADKLDGGE